MLSMDLSGTANGARVAQILSPSDGAFVPCDQSGAASSTSDSIQEGYVLLNCADTSEMQRDLAVTAWGSTLIVWLCMQWLKFACYSSISSTSIVCLDLTPYALVRKLQYRLGCKLFRSVFTGVALQRLVYPLPPGKRMQHARDL